MAQRRERLLKHVRAAQVRAKTHKDNANIPFHPLRMELRDRLAAGYIRDLESFRTHDANLFVRMVGGVFLGESPQYGSEEEWVFHLTGMLCTPDGHALAVSTGCREDIRAFLRAYCEDDPE